MKVETQIPIYRAKKINSDEPVEGTAIKVRGLYYISKNGINSFYPIDPSTLTISFDSGKTWDTIDKAAEHVALCRIDNF